MASTHGDFRGLSTFAGRDAASDGSLQPMLFVDSLMRMPKAGATDRLASAAMSEDHVLVTGRQGARGVVEPRAVAARGKAI
jgi:hypothetical protein